jgi:Zn-dependent protease with chaperone function
VLTAAIALGIFAVLLAWPIPLVLSAAKWPSRAPGFALLLWQAIALAGGLSMIGSLLTFGLVPFGDTLRSGLLAASRSLTEGFHATGADIVSIVALGGAILLGVHLLLNLAFTVGVTGRERRRHRALVDILSSPSPDRPNTRLIDSTAPVAYCLPGSIDSLTVLSQGIVALLDDPQLHSVIEHERAHLRQRHSAVLLAFDAWRSSLPWFPIASRAQREVGTLVEMLADDAATRTASPDSLALALALVAGSDSIATSDRVARLLAGQPRLGIPQRALIGLTAVALVAVPTILLIVPSVA